MRFRILLIAVAAFAAVAVVGCGGDDNGSDEDSTAAATAADTTAADTGTGGGVTIEMGDYFFNPQDVTAKAGSVTISAPNVGQVEHELVLFKSDADPASLPTTSSGDVDEKALEKQGAELGGEIEEVLPDETKEGTFKLTAGKYVMFCNLPTHYQQGMYGSVTIN